MSSAGYVSEATTGVFRYDKLTVVVVVVAGVLEIVVVVVLEVVRSASEG